MFKIYTDGATEGYNGKLGTVKHCGIGFYCETNNFSYSNRIEALSNNEAEFWALITAMKWASLEGIKEVTFYLDSQIVVNRALGHRPKAKFKNERMDRLQDLVFDLKKNFDKCYFVWISRWKNQIADNLSKQSLQKTWK